MSEEMPRQKTLVDAPKVEEKPAPQEGLRRLPRIIGAVGPKSSVSSHLRTIKMARPKCSQNALASGIGDCEKAGWGWWNDCPHDPYFHTSMTPEITPILEDDPTQPGTQIVKGQKEVLRSVTLPNVAQVALDVTVNSGNGVAQALALKGFKTLRDIGYLPMCQFGGCYSQDITVVIQDGEYCSEDHAKRIKVTAGHQEKERKIPVNREEFRELLDKTPLI